MTEPTSQPPTPPVDGSTEPVLLSVTGGVATITMNRPDAMNSLDIATKELLRDIVQSVAADDAVRCVVLTGTGRGFCVGQDLKEHIELLRNGSSDELFTTVERHYNPIVTALATMPKPVIAAVNGIAAGAGASLALACDLRVLADTAGFNFAFAGVALSCDTGASYHLPRPGRLETKRWCRLAGSRLARSLSFVVVCGVPIELPKQFCDFSLLPPSYELLQCACDSRLLRGLTADAEGFVEQILVESEVRGHVCSSSRCSLHSWRAKSNSGLPWVAL